MKSTNDVDGKVYVEEFLYYLTAINFDLSVCTSSFWASATNMQPLKSKMSAQHYTLKVL